MGLKGEYRLVFTTSDRTILDLWDELHEDDVNLGIKKWRRGRSLDANAYAWALLDKLAEKLNRPKVDIYREEIRDIAGVSDVICIQEEAVERLVREWGRNGLGWFCEVSPSKIPGCRNVQMFYGSSSYDTKQMAALIDHIIQDCQQLQIETATPQELAAMEEQWGRREAKKPKADASESP